jgi:hypothetical protein
MQTKQIFGNRLLSETQSMKYFAAACTLLMMLLLLYPSHMSAQLATADVLGTVTDSTGAVVPDAKVTIRNTGTGITQTTQSGKTGEYLFSHLQIGTYKLTVEAKGFKTSTTTGVTLAVGDRARMDAKLEVGSQVETVEVESVTAPALQTDSSEMSTLISTTAVADLPLNGRNITNLVQLSAGVTEGTSNALSSGASFQDRRQTSSFSANGQNDFLNNQMVDGMDNNERAIGTQIIKPSIDAIDQVKVLTNLFPAEYGRTEGGVINVITKSGTNKIHGTLFEYLRNDVLNTTPYSFTAGVKKGELRQNQFGGSVGGPILKNKAFFFSDYEGFRQVTATTIDYSTVPDYADQQAVANATVGETVILDDGMIKGDPTYTATVTQLGKNLMALYPEPTSKTAVASTNNYAYAPKKTQFAKTIDGRVDYHLSDNNLLFARYSWNNTLTDIPSSMPYVTINGQKYGNGTVTGNPGKSTIQTQGLALDWTHTFTRNLLLEAKAGYSRFYNQASPVNGEDAATNIGFAACPAIAASASNLQYCISSPYGGANMGLPGMGVDQYSSIGDGKWVPLIDINNSYQYQGSLSWNHGSHSVKGGLSLIRRQLHRAQSSTARGSYVSNALISGNSDAYGDGLAAMVQGIASNVQQQTALNNPNFRSWEPSVFIQDDWRALPWLTINIGVRYDIYTPYTDIAGSFSNLNVAKGVLQSPSLVGIYHGSRTADISTDYSNISPRVGFSASLTHRIVLRGGFGMAYFPNEVGSGTAVSLANFPYTWSKTYGSTSGSYYPVPTGMQTNPTAGTCSASKLSACAITMANGLEEPYLDPTTVGPTNLEGGGNEIDAVANDLKSGHLAQYSLEIQKEFGANVFSIGFIGNQGRRLPVVPDANQAAYATPTAASLAAGCSNDSTATLGKCKYTQGPTLYNPKGGEDSSVTTTEDGQNLWGDMIYLTSSASTSIYDAMLASFTRRLSKGLATSLNYTLSHALNNGSPQGEGNNRSVECVKAGCLEDMGNGTTRTLSGFREYDYGNSDLNVSSRFAGTVNYALPFAKSSNGIIGYAAKGWNVNATVVYQTGLPVSISENSSGNASNISGITGFRGGDTPNQISTPHHPHKLTEWFDTTAYGFQTPGTLGNTRRNTIIGPRQRHMDLSLAKDFPLQETIKLQFRAEAFNLTNTVNMGEPNTSLTTSAFGTITSTSNGYNPRLLQFALRLSF